MSSVISRSSRLLVPLFGLILASCLAARADAQTQAILAQVADQWPSPARVISVDLDQSAVAWEIRPPIDGFTPTGPVAATSDGRYTVWSAWRWDGGKGESALFARETASGVRASETHGGLCADPSSCSGAAGKGTAHTVETNWPAAARS